MSEYGLHIDITVGTILIGVVVLALAITIWPITLGVLGIWLYSKRRKA